MISHHNQLLSLEAKSVECCTIKVHFARDNPKPESAPYLEAMVWQKHINNKNPIQLNINATKTKFIFFGLNNRKIDYQKMQCRT